MTFPLISAFCLGFITACIVVLIMLAIGTRRLKRQHAEWVRQLEQLDFWKEQSVISLHDALQAYNNGDMAEYDRAVQRLELNNKRFWQEANKKI